MRKRTLLFRLIRRTRHWAHYPATENRGGGGGWGVGGGGFTVRTRIRTRRPSNPSSVTEPFLTTHTDHLVFCGLLSLSVQTVFHFSVPKDEDDYTCFSYATVDDCDAAWRDILWLNGEDARNSLRRDNHFTPFYPGCLLSETGVAKPTAGLQLYFAQTVQCSTQLSITLIIWLACFVTAKPIIIYFRRPPSALRHCLPLAYMACFVTAKSTYVHSCAFFS